MNLKEKIDVFCQEHNISCLFADGFDDAIIGLGSCFNSYKVIYDKDKVIEILCKEMTYEEAIEHFEYNIIGSYVGDETPVFLENLTNL
jgi:hypothetical protein